MRALVWSTLMILAWAGPSLAGIVMTDAEGGRTYISEGRLKHVDGDGNVSIFSVEREEMVLADPEREVYAKGTVKDFCQAGQGIIDQAMAQMSPEEREIMKQFMAAQEQSQTPPVVAIANAGSGGSIAGFETVRYGVTVNGEPYEDVWLAQDPSLMEEMKNLRKLLAMTAEIAGCMGQGIGITPVLDPENTPEYRALYEIGFPLKTISLAEGSSEVTDEIVAVEKTSLDEKTFQPPGEYREVAYEEFLEGQ